MVRDYFGGLPPDEFPNLVARTGAIFAGNIDGRFESGLDLLVRGLAAVAAAAGSGEGGI